MQSDILNDFGYKSKFQIILSISSCLFTEFYVLTLSYAFSSTRGLTFFLYYACIIIFNSHLFVALIHFRNMYVCAHTCTRAHSTEGVCSPCIWVCQGAHVHSCRKSEQDAQYLTFWLSTSMSSVVWNTRGLSTPAWGSPSLTPEPSSWNLVEVKQQPSSATHLTKTSSTGFILLHSSKKLNLEDGVLICKSFFLTWNLGLYLMSFRSC